MRDLNVAIVGGGIGGLATALAMKQVGFDVTVYERSPQLVDQGAGITLAPNATPRVSSTHCLRSSTSSAGSASKRKTAACRASARVAPLPRACGWSCGVVPLEVMRRKCFRTRVYTQVYFSARAVAAGYRPFHCGLRFSRNALMPS